MTDPEEDIREAIRVIQTRFFRSPDGPGPIHPNLYRRIQHDLGLDGPVTVDDYSRWIALYLVRKP